MERESEKNPPSVWGQYTKMVCRKSYFYKKEREKERKEGRMTETRKEEIKERKRETE